MRGNKQNMQKNKTKTDRDHFFMTLILVLFLFCDIETFAFFGLFSRKLIRSESFFGENENN